MKVFRWRGVVPLGIGLAAGVVAWVLLADRLVQREVESSGTEIVGARVDLASADVRLRDGVVALRGLQVTDPQHPMKNLVQADEILVNVRVAPLLENKVVIDTVAIRGVRFGTPRRTSGALAHPGPTTGLIARRITAWRDSLHLPALSLSGLGQVVNVQGIDSDSLTTLRQARQLVQRADSARTAWLDSLRILDPRPRIDSAQALAQRLQGASLRTLGITGVRDAVSSVRRTLDDLSHLDDRLKGLQATATTGVSGLQNGLTQLDDARRTDYAYARRLLQLPSLSAPDIGAALFGQVAADRVAPVLYWVDVAGQYMPPGLQARLRQGPDRVRASGTDVIFTKDETYPSFLLRFAEATLAVGGSSVAAGDYAARITGLTSAPAVYGQPATFALSRVATGAGPSLLQAAGVLDHVRQPSRDSLSFRAEGISLPTLDLSALDATLALGRGTTRLDVTRTGDSINVRWVWRSSDVTWQRPQGNPSGLAQQLLWNTLSGMRDVQIETRLSGPLSRPRLSVATNLATAVAASVRRELGDQVARAEAQVRARVDALVQDRVGEARSMVDSVRSVARERVDVQRQRLDQARSELQARLKQLTGFSIGLSRAAAPHSPARDRASAPSARTPPGSALRPAPGSGGRPG